ncbi:MAG TPA: DUF559 domain-containing protein [Micromonosporaceae bacterium]|nr:DUF559 domain-containing protein [Micromonosporaceae bacterium]
MPPSPRVPRELRLLPFRGSAAVASGLLTWGQLRGPTWRRLLPDVYVAADVEVDHRLLCGAALVFARRAGGTGFVAVSGSSALMCWGIDVVQPRTQFVELTVPSARRLDSRPGALRLVRSILRAHEVATFGSLTLTSPARTAFDVVRRCGRVDGIVALDAMLRQRLLPRQTLLDYALEVAGRPGCRMFADAIALAEPLSESPMETRCRLALMDGGLPRPVAQYVVRDMSGRFVARLDLAYPSHQIGIEYEGDYHRERTTFRRDIERINTLTALGWIVVRTTADDIYRNPDQLVRRINELLRRQRP